MSALLDLLELMGQRNPALLKRISIGAQLVRKRHVHKNKTVKRSRAKRFQGFTGERRSSSEVAKQASKASCTVDLVIFSALSHSASYFGCSGEELDS
jgi:hypothetical protein